ncbi:MAG: Mur ligase family protein [Patescibacteria group bacterium]
MQSLALLTYHAKRPYHFIKTGLLKGIPAQIRFQFPNTALKILLITGTDGKTTSASILYHQLNAAGYKTALLSTVAAYVGEVEHDTGFHVTSPQPNDIYQFMREAVDQNCHYLVMEATSHGAYQYRTWGIRPIIAGLTNITHEHLDYHITYREYVKAKASLLKSAKHIIVNEDDQSFSLLKKLLPAKSWETYSAQDALPAKIKSAINTRFPEEYNQMNARLVYNMLKPLDIADDKLADGFTSFPGVPGRMEVVSEKPCKIIVDFAHTPQGLRATLSALKKQLSKNGKLIAVYGAAGLRDRTKRPIMGQIGTQLADYVIFTTEDPRTEDVWSIIRQMKEQLTEHHDKIISIADRQAAIEFAVTKLAGPSDTVAILGKGHEKSICIGTTEFPWSDQAAVQQAIAPTP